MVDADCRVFVASWAKCICDLSRIHFEAEEKGMRGKIFLTVAAMLCVMPHADPSRTLQPKPKPPLGAAADESARSRDHGTL